MTEFDQFNPFYTFISHREELTTEQASKMVYHIEISLKGSSIIYEPGDSIGIFPENNTVHVNEILNALSFEGSEVVEWKDENYSLKNFLTKKANISLINRDLIVLLENTQTDHDKKQKLTTLLSNENCVALSSYIQKHHVWDLLQEFGSEHVNPQDLCNTLSAIVPRYYSIASSMSEVGESVHLTVALVDYYNTQQRLGVCSHYLIESLPLNENLVPIFLQKAEHFHLPNDSSEDMIMIGPGTGIAPFRGFMQERLKTEMQGNHWLFFGDWYREHCYFYEEYWRSLDESGNLRIETAFSRDQEHKIYVQHKLQEHAAEIWNWVQNGAYIYICGDKVHMAKDVKRALIDIFIQQGGMNEKEAKRFLRTLRQQKRLREDIY